MVNPPGNDKAHVEMRLETYVSGVRKNSGITYDYTVLNIVPATATLAAPASSDDTPGASGVVIDTTIKSP